MTDLETILSWFQTGDMPTQEEFKETFSSFRHNNTKIPIAEVDGLESSLNNKLNVGDYVKDGKIRADKIEALGLTELIESFEKDISDFVENSGKYEFQQNDFIAIPGEDGNFSLYLFKGGDKKIKENYLPTGLTNISISMVEGLQDALNRKLEKPTVDGNYFVNMLGNPSYKSINPGENYLLFWDGSNFKNSSIFRENGGLKFGIGTNTPSEQLHLTNRARMRALVLEDNSEALPQQVTYDNRGFYGTDITGLKRRLMFSDYEAIYETFNNMTPEQNLIISQLLNGGAGSGGNMSVSLISPPIVQNQYDSVEYVMLQGANLNLSAISRKIEILGSDKTTVLAVIPDNQVQTYDNGLSLVFYYNFYNFQEGQKFLRLTSGSKVYITTLDLTVVPKITNIDLSTITWEKLYGSDIIPDSNDLAIGSNVIATSAIGATTSLPTISFKSSELFEQGDDFYIELKVDLLNRDNGGTGYVPSFIGLGYSGTANNLIPLNQVWFEYSWASGMNYYLTKNNGSSIMYDGVPRSFTVVFIKTGNLFRTIIDNNNVSKMLTNNSGYSIFMQLVTRPGKTPNSIQIVKAFKMN